ncbi:MAG: efflux transporter outer membrane subunit [Deltaproteobacteria bacterium]|nr:efflux transporter outer membrane subunit [Deltaproteobacteria bacterium]MBW2361712.1 efflux transporter outer membrane subunit [Deltaproteobacteria bacterium]
MLRKLFCAALALALASCKLTPDYERPELGLPSAWLEPAEASGSVVNLPWWELYQDETLRGLIQAALDENEDLAIALLRIQELEYQLTVTRADQFPFLDAFGGAGRGRASRQMTPGASATSQFSIGATLSFELDLWRKFSRATEAARADLLATEAAHRSVTITLVASVASTYFLLRDLDARLAISEGTVKSRRQSLEIVQARFDRGTVPELDVNQAQIELATAEVAVAGFERSTVQTRNALRVLLGRFPGPIERGLALTEQPLPPEVPAGLPSELLSRRPDIAVAEQQLIADTARVGVAEAFRYPAVSLSGSIALVTDELTDFNTSEAKAWNIAADLFQPLFNSGRLKAQSRAQAARAEQAVHAFVATVQQALREVEDSLIAVRTLRTEHEARARQVVAARNAARLSRARYDAGVVDYLELQDAERTLFASELDESATRQAALTAVVGLYKALGGGWEAELAAVPQP